MKKTLIIGYGNYDREDDGVAWHILVDIARRLGRPIPNVPEDGFLPEGDTVDLWFEMQLAPEMSEDFSRYERICFVDAHTGNIEEEVSFQLVEGSPAASSFTHHLTAAACMALTRSLYKQEPEAMLLSVRGYRFGFARELSPETAALVGPAVDTIWQWMEE